MTERRAALPWPAAFAAFALLAWAARHDALRPDVCVEPVGSAGGCPRGTPVLPFALPAAILLATFATRGGHNWRLFAAVPGGLAVGAALGGDWGIVLGAGLTVGALLASYGYALAARRRDAALARTGVQGYGTVLAVVDTSTVVNGHPRVRLTVRVERPDAAPYDATTTLTMPRVSMPRPGDRYPVWVDPADPRRWTLDPGTFTLGDGVPDPTRAGGGTG
ncbi:MAG TPA: DUF3592 domain-containing protein [Frankiaceae bacterium]|nr:DUF3592 domain-containing protein [Frankiaceae bacterium]